MGDQTNRGRINMNQKLVIALLIGLFTVAMAGCRTAPVYDVTDAPIVANKPSYTLDDVRKAIQRAGSSLGWQMQEVDPNTLEGTLHLRSHMAQVDIPYTKENYSIAYKDSSNLKYDGKIIHSNYNGWIQNLDRAIKVQLNTL
jgi:hypothetical protein